MIESRIGVWRRTGGVLVAAGVLALSGAALATEQSQQRQQGRDANQAAKQDARGSLCKVLDYGKVHGKASYDGIADATSPCIVLTIIDKQ
jgi:hypothetical protein